MKTSGEIPELEKKIYNRLNFVNEYLKIRMKYNKISSEEKYTKLNDVKIIFKESGFKYKYLGENCHQINLHEYKEYNFNINFIIQGNYVDTRYYIFKDDIYFAPKESSLNYLLNLIPFNEKLLNPNFGFNSESELKNYIFEIIDLCNKFSYEYIKEIEAGKVSLEWKKIIFRIATNLSEINEDTFRRYCKEISEKYPPGSKIANSEIGDKLFGKYYLELPESNLKFDKINEYKKIAKDLGVELIFKSE